MGSFVFARARIDFLRSGDATLSLELSRVRVLSKDMVLQSAVVRRLITMRTSNGQLQNFVMWILWATKIYVTDKPNLRLERGREWMNELTSNRVPTHTKLHLSVKCARSRWTMMSSHWGLKHWLWWCFVAKQSPDKLHSRELRPSHSPDFLPGRHRNGEILVAYTR